MKLKVKWKSGNHYISSCPCAGGIQHQEVAVAEYGHNQMKMMARPESYPIDAETASLFCATEDKFFLGTNTSVNKN